MLEAELCRRIRLAVGRLGNSPARERRRGGEGILARRFGTAVCRRRHRGRAASFARAEAKQQKAQRRCSWMVPRGRANSGFSGLHLAIRISGTLQAGSYRVPFQRM